MSTWPRCRCARRCATSSGHLHPELHAPRWGCSLAARAALRDRVFGLVVRNSRRGADRPTLQLRGGGGCRDALTRPQRRHDRAPERRDRWSLPTGSRRYRHQAECITRPSPAFRLELSADVQVRTWQDDRVGRSHPGPRRRRAAAPGGGDRRRLPAFRVGWWSGVRGRRRRPASASLRRRADQTIQVIFDEPPFTVLHELAHVWTDHLLPATGGSARDWRRTTPRRSRPSSRSSSVRPQRARTKLKGTAFALSGWAFDEPPSPERDRFGYAASWALMTDRRVGWLRRPLRGRAARGGGHRRVRVTPRRDRCRRARAGARGPRLEKLHRSAGAGQRQGSGRAVGAQHPERERHRAASEAGGGARRVREAGGRGRRLGTPAPIRQRLGAWDFDGAMPLIAEASAWLEKRDALTARLEAWADRTAAAAGSVRGERRRVRGRTMSSRRRVAWRRPTGPHSSGRTGGRSLVERVGLLGVPDPSAHLAGANALFAAGDLTGAGGCHRQARRSLDQAATAGWLRIVSALVVLVAVVALLVALASRRVWPGRGRSGRLSPLLHCAPTTTDTPALGVAAPQFLPAADVLAGETADVYFERARRILAAEGHRSGRHDGDLRPRGGGPLRRRGGARLPARRFSAATAVRRRARARGRVAARRRPHRAARRS